MVVEFKRAVDAKPIALPDDLNAKILAECCAGDVERHAVGPFDADASGVLERREEVQRRVSFLTRIGVLSPLRERVEGEDLEQMGVPVPLSLEVPLCANAFSIGVGEDLFCTAAWFEQSTLCDGANPKRDRKALETKRM